MDTINLSIENALSFGELTKGQAVVVMHTNSTDRKEWIKAHTGTITSIDAVNIGFNLAKNRPDVSELISIDKLRFPDLPDTLSKLIYIVDAVNLPDMDTAQSQYPNSATRPTLFDPNAWLAPKLSPEG
ncbi:MAG TPA: hypothetical protein VIM31_00250 [Candidatus Microsaccharimonas sp.]|jgi:hypothetical protein